MKKFKFPIFIIALTVIVFNACKKEKDDHHDHDHNHNNPSPQNNQPSQAYGKVIFNFENFVGSDTLKSMPFVNENGDTVTVSLFNYYISNIVLSNSSTIFKERDSYHLIIHTAEASKSFMLDSVPVGSYNTLTFLIGVDSIRNVSGVQSGALDPANGMFWSWNSGYIMAKLEGTSPQSGATNKNVKYHIGGFSGANNSLKTVSFTLTTPLNITKDNYSKINLKADVLEWFKNPNIISLSTLHTVHMPGANAKIIADNYADMFSVISVIN